jgi:DNA repair protein RadC
MSDPKMRKVSLVKVLTVMEEASNTKVDAPEIAAKFWRRNVATMPIFDDHKEHLVVLLLNTRYSVTGFNLVSVGSLNESIAHPRDIFRPALVAGSFAIILMHNHPSGDCTPSQVDHSLTRRLVETGELLQVKLLDHVIIGESSHFSFKEAGIV